MLGSVQHWLGRHREAVGTFRHLSDAAGRIVANRLWVGWVETLALGTLGEYEEALRLLETLQSTSERVGDVLILPRVFNTLGWIYGELQDLQRGVEWNQAWVDFVQGIPGFPNPDVEPHARLNLGDYLVALGRPDEAEVHFQRSRRGPTPSTGSAPLCRPATREDVATAVLTNDAATVHRADHQPRSPTIIRLRASRPFP